MTTAVKPPRSLLRLAGQAIADYAMVRSGDRLLLGLSGGKDPLSLLHVLLHLRDKSPVHFELAIATVDPRIDGYDPFYLADDVASLGLPYFYRRQTIVARALKTMRGDSFCAYCARMRRGFSTTPRGNKATTWLVRWRNIWTILAESFLMSAFYKGRLRTMKAHYVERRRRLCASSARWFMCVTVDGRFCHPRRSSRDQGQLSGLLPDADETAVHHESSGCCQESENKLCSVVY